MTQIRVGVLEGFAYYSVKLALLASSNRYEVDSNTFFKVVFPSVHLEDCIASTLTFYCTNSYM
jgi:hypothetical protein